MTCLINIIAAVCIKFNKKLTFTIYEFELPIPGLFLDTVLSSIFSLCCSIARFLYEWFISCNDGAFSVVLVIFGRIRLLKFAWFNKPTL